MEERVELASSVSEFKFNKKRVRVLQGVDGDMKRECKVYHLIETLFIN